MRAAAKRASNDLQDLELANEKKCYENPMAFGRFALNYFEC